MEWALVHRGANKEAFIVSSSRKIDALVQMYGGRCIGLQQPIPPYAGFWKYSFEMDGPLRAKLTKQELVNYRGAAALISKHESFVPTAK